MSTTVHPGIYRNLQVATGHLTKLLLKTEKINLVMAHGFRFGNYLPWNVFQEIIASEPTNMPSAFASRKCEDDLTLRPQESGYSQLFLRQTPLGPALSVRLREVSVL